MVAPRGGAVSFERGIPVPKLVDSRLRLGVHSPVSFGQTGGEPWPGGHVSGVQQYSD